ncbi:hypothetical protein B0H16DRAFT_1713012 [Mycena metata]|uniref:Uncharacterized protein n=1 Tax=Mycena metata TaxID=1033252 RepID=A0AAD7K019_9AGAR|nr:hypothetical protein B0H16DRAFT_1713012 [Mycena metata]
MNNACQEIYLHNQHHHRRRPRRATAKRASSAPAPETAVPTTPSPVSLPAVPGSPAVALDDTATPVNATDVDAIDIPVSRMIVDALVPSVNNVHPETIDVDALNTALSDPVQTTNTDTITPAPTSTTTISVAADLSSITNAQSVSLPLNQYPHLPTPGQEIQSEPKGKGKEKVVEEVTTAADSYDPYPDIAKDGFENFDRPDSPDTAAATAHALSLDQQLGQVTAGASSSRRPGEEPPSPSSKHQCANTAGDTVPTSPRTSTPRISRRMHNPTAEHGLPPRGSYTPTPEDGWHLLFGIDEESIWRAHPEVQRQFWDDEPQPKFLVIVSGGNRHHIQTRDTIATALANFVNVDPDLFQPPTEAILAKGALSCAEITLFAVPYSPPLAGFIGTMSGFTLRNTPAGAGAAQEHIRSAMAGDAAITQYLRLDVDADGALGIFLASVGVHGINLLVDNNTTVMAWNVYVVSPTESVTHFNHLRKLFASLVIITTCAGRGKIHKALGCSICPCINRPTNLCPFPRAPGWMGATPDTIGALLDISRAARATSNCAPHGNSIRGCGGHGNGRGNGRGGNGRGRGN